METLALHPGQHIRTPRFLYSHHGIFEGWDSFGIPRVIAAGTPGNPHGIARVSLAEFRNGNRVEVVAHPEGLPPYQVLARALSRLGEQNYSVWSNNCEHFATWCATGVQSSSQVRFAGLLGGIGIACALFGS